MSGIAGWSSGNQSAGPYRLPIWARVNESLDPGNVCMVVVSGAAAGAGAAGAGGVAGGGVVKP